jgi:multidrug resistance protein, MATE family
MLGVERDRLRRILGLALPIIGGMVSQNVLNVVDTLMVSRLGPVALAAVGFGGFATFLAGAFLTGMSAGVQAAAARRKGEGRLHETAIPLNGGLLTVAAIGLPLSVALVLLTPELFPLLTTDPDVVETGTPYLQARLVALVAIGMNFSFRGYWNGVDLPWLYLKTLLVMHACNVFLNFGLIFGYFGFPALGATGAGIGTAIATAVGTAYYFYLGTRHARGAGFLRAVPPLEVIRRMLRLSVPSGLQQLFFAAGFTMLFVIIDRIGTAEVAAANVLINVGLVAYLPGLALGLASASLVGQALGRGDVDDAARWAREVVRVGAAILAILGLPMLLAPRLILGAFFPEDPAALELAVTPMRLAGGAMAIEAVGMILMNSVMGAGATTLSMLLGTSLQWLLFLPAAYLVGPVLGLGLTGVWTVNVGYRLVAALAFAAVWRSRIWAGSKI